MAARAAQCGCGVHGFAMNPCDSAPIATAPYYREARVTVDWRQTACGAASLRSPHYKKKRPRERSFLSFVGAAEEVVDGGSVEVGQFN